jgi:hypothetical protein
MGILKRFGKMYRNLGRERLPLGFARFVEMSWKSIPRAVMSIAQSVKTLKNKKQRMSFVTIN